MSPHDNRGDEKDPIEPVSDEREQDLHAPSAEDEETRPNPPRTTTNGWFTAPKFGSAGSGGFEFEPGPERD